MVSRRTLVHAVRLCLISGATHSTAPAAGDHLVRAHHLKSFYSFSKSACPGPSPQQLQYISSKSAAPAIIAQLLLLGTHRTTALASSSLPIFDRRDVTVPTSQSCLGRRESFLWRSKIFEPRTESSQNSVGRQRKTASHRISQFL